jgi:23S rRNA (uracil1939-C5)-methyltransferase
MTAIELNLHGIAHGGEAIGRHAGKVVFTPYAIPGERVRVEIVEEKERWARARLVEVLEASPDRVTPPCPYFGPGQCGGCQWQHIAYPRQAELKQEIVADQLRRLAHLADPPVADIAVPAGPASPDEAPAFLDYGYRNQVRFGMTPDGKPGFRRTDGPGLIAVDRCPLLHERLDAVHAALDVAWPGLTAIAAHVGVNTGQAMIVLETQTDEGPELELDVPAACVLLTGRGLTPLIGDPWIEELAAGRRYRISAGSAFPANTTGAEVLVEIVSVYAGLQPDDVLLDLYSGVGLYALALGDSAAEVICVEPSPEACEDFAANAGEQANVSLHEGAIEEVAPALGAYGQHVDVAVMNSPYAGVGAEAIAGIAALGPRRIVYLSRDPASLARDALHFIAAGYRLNEVQPVDLAPQTYHVEAVAFWAKET